MTNAIFFKVEYDTKVFDLTALQSVFNFIFELYNCLPAAKADNDSLDKLKRRLIEAKDSVVKKKIPTLNTKRKHKETKHDSKRSRGPPASGGGGETVSTINQ